MTTSRSSTVRRDAKLAFLASLPPFRRWRSAEITRLGAISELCRLSTGALIQDQGTVVRHAVYVVEGTALRVGGQAPVGLLGAGAWWGDGLLGRPGSGRSPESIWALGPMTVLLVEARSWRALAGDARLGVPAKSDTAPEEARQGAGASPPRKNRSNRPSTPAPCSVIPPSTTTVWPVTKRAFSEQRNRTTSATSSGAPTRARGVMRS